MQKKRIFNLLKPIKPPPTVWDKIYDWIIGKARVVIIFVEILVVSAFVLKVIEDTNAKNKQKEIESLNAELSFYSIEMEPRFREIIKKSDIYLEMQKEASVYSKVLEEIFGFIGLDQPSVNVRIAANKLTIVGYDNLSNLKKLEEALKTKSKTLQLSSVKVGNLSLDQEDILAQKGQIVLEASLLEDLLRK